ncbi:MAG: type III pantothenate kinase [Burkholderiaceae bacterium]
MSVLLIDVGNSRVKWCWADDLAQALPPPAHILSAPSGADDGSRHCPWDQDMPERLSVDAVFFVTVAQGNWRNRICAWAAARGIDAGELRSQRSGPQNLQNRYREPAALGADRWALAIATHGYFPTEDCVIVGCGTATTIDALSARDGLLGGLILPGPRAMLAVLAGATAGLPDLSEHTPPARTDFDVPDNTVDAMYSGTQLATVGAVRQLAMHMRLRNGGGAVNCLVTGGAAPWILPVLPDAVHRPHWVLEGLRRWANDTRC